jgi:caa(3)-type oxidase subunit IV
MSEHNEHHGDGHDVNYFKIYVALVVLLIISILGPEVGIEWVTLITAFGVAIVKATMVVQNFMHLKWEKTIMKWMLAISLAFVALFFFGVSPDIMKHEGVRWTNDAALAAIARGIPDAGTHGEEGEHGAEAEGEGAAEEAPAEEPAAPVAFNAATTFSTTCATCHGTDGGGDGPGSAALDPKPAAFNTEAFWEQTNEEEMAKVIQQGGAAAGRSAAMPAWGALFNEEQTQQLIEYIKTFRPE